MDRTQPFEHILIPEISNYSIEFLEEDHHEFMDCLLSDESEDQKIAESNQGMECTQVKTEPTEENLTSEIDIEEHPIKWDPLEDHQYCIPKDAAGTNSVRKKVDGIVEILKCDMCVINFTCPEILAWHTENCHGIDAIVKVVKISDKEVKYMCWSCNGMFMGLELIISHLLLHRINNWPFRCNVCDITFMMKHHFTEHGLVCKKKKTARDNIKKSQERSATVTWRKKTNARNPEEGQLDCLLSTYMIDEAVLRRRHKQSKLRGHQCKHCSIMYAHREMLNWHIEHCHGPDQKIKVLHSGVFGSIYQCVLCQVKDNRFGSIIQHLINKHQFSKLPYQCNICQCRQFICKSLLLNHKLICNKTTSQVNYNDLQLNDIQEPTKEILCQEVEDHTITVESEDDSLSLPVLQINNEVAIQQYNELYPQRKLQCEHCGLRYAHREMLKWHIEYCHGHDPKIKVLQYGNRVVGFQCVFCEAVINNFHLIIQHLRYQHQLTILPYHCNICKCRQFTSKCFLKTHKLMCKKRKLQVDQNGIHNVRQFTTKEISCQEIRDHSIKVDTGDDQLDLPEHQIDDVELTQGKNLLECRVLVRKLLECDSCSFITNNKAKLTNHMLAHLTPNALGRRRSRNRRAAAKKSFKHGCSMCDKKYFRPEMLAWHSENCHGSDAIVKIVKDKKNLGKYQCVFCEASCVGLTVMIQHLRNRHRLSNLPFRCNFCDNRFILLTNLNIHRLKCNMKDFLLSPTSLLKIEKTIFVKCKMCNEKFETEKKMRNHISHFHAVVKDLRYKCGHCQDSFNIFSKFKSHCHKSHPGKPNILKCSVCKPDEFYEGFKNDEHVGADFTCKCGSKFRYIRKKETYIQMRPKKKSECKYCDAKFKHNKHLEQHVRISHRRALHYCQFCMFNSVRKVELTLHIRNCHLQPGRGKI